MVSLRGASPGLGSPTWTKYALLSRVKLTFRGTRVVKPEDLRSITALKEKLADVNKDLQTDAEVSLVPWSGRSGGRVHSGFRNSLDEMWPEVAARVEAIREGRSLWLCGHSLGGALATLAADRLTGITGVFTFGSPAVGDAGFASRWDVPGMRFRNFTDIVPWLPPAMLKYRHVKSGGYFNSDGELVSEPTDLRLIVDALLGAPEGFAESVRGLMKGQAMALAPSVLRDHAPLLYVVKTWRTYARESGQTE